MEIYFANKLWVIKKERFVALLCFWFIQGKKDFFNSLLLKLSDQMRRIFIKKINNFTGQFLVIK